MASPSMESFCCVGSRTQSHPNVEWIIQMNFVPYNVVCTVSALIGLLGAIYQLLPYAEDEGISRRHRLSVRSQRRIIRWLAFADLMATSGILIRSTTWLSRSSVNPSPVGELVFCAVTSTWIHFFYSATYLWTIFYAVDMYLATKERTCQSWKYHISTWSFSTLVTSISLFTLYFPDFQCHDKSDHVMVNYIFTDIPIVLAMVVNPILYVLAMKQERVLLTSYHAQFSDNERRLLSTMREKFIFIVLVFYCCWMPNIINGILMWTTWPNVNRPLFVGLMYMMAVLNPLQAFLNSLVYRGWTFCGKTVFNLYHICCIPRPSEGVLAQLDRVLEDDDGPLVTE